MRERKLKPIQLLELAVKTALLICITVAVIANRDIFYDVNYNHSDEFLIENHSGRITCSQPHIINFVTSEDNASHLLFLMVPPEEQGGLPVKMSVYVDGSPVMEKQLTEKEIHSGIYIKSALPAEYPQGSSVQVVFETEETDPAKACRIAYGKNAKSDVVSWYCSSDQYPDVPAVNLVYRHLGKLPLALFSLMTVMCAAAIVFRYLNLKGIYLPAFFRNLPDMLFMLCMPAITLWCVESMGFGNFLNLKLQIKAVNLAIIYSLTLIAYIFVRRILHAAVIANIFTVCFAMVNHYLQLFRGSVLLPSDILGAATAARILDKYTFTPDMYVLCGGMVIVFLLMCTGLKFTAYLAPKLTKKAFAVKLAVAVLSVALLVPPALQPRKFGGNLSLYTQLHMARAQNGFLYNFLMNIPLVVHTAPEGYEPQALADMINTGYSADIPAGNSALTAAKKPNIVAIMNESFSDPRTLLNINENNGKLLPFIDSLKADSRARVGQAGVSVFGGGTSCSEYEFLTGFAMRTDRANFAPYMTYMNSKKPTLVSQMQSLGYKTTGIHLQPSQNWYRNTAYPVIGFDRTLFLDLKTNTLDDSSGKLDGTAFNDISDVSQYPSDAYYYRTVIDMMKEESEPLFSFCVTMQNHGPYADSEEVLDWSSAEWCDYLTLMNTSDNRLKEFLSQLEDFDEPTAVIFFGDHWSYFTNQKLLEQGIDFNSFSMEQLTKYYSTPYVAWSNCGYDFSQMPQQTSLPYLASQFLQQLGLELTDYQKYLLNMSQDYPVFTYYVVDGVGDEQLLRQYEFEMSCLHYNALNDKKDYVEDIFTLK